MRTRLSECRSSSERSLAPARLRRSLPMGQVVRHPRTSRERATSRWPRSRSAPSPIGRNASFLLLLGDDLGEVLFEYSQLLGAPNEILAGGFEARSGEDFLDFPRPLGIFSLCFLAGACESLE